MSPVAKLTELGKLFKAGYWLALTFPSNMMLRDTMYGRMKYRWWVGLTGAVELDSCPFTICPPAIPQVLLPPTHWLCRTTLSVNTKPLTGAPLEKTMAPL